MLALVLRLALALPGLLLEVSGLALHRLDQGWNPFEGSKLELIAYGLSCGNRIATGWIACERCRAFADRRPG